jgi:UDP-N-acetylglucosamine--N-acetylmuramyl-(pentapeptide) pyrophosphoryl-undecaprenol N-acetylglucosamine transferase
VSTIQPLTNELTPKRVLIAAAGTGGHIFPGLAVAEALRQKGWIVTWLGTRSGMENRIVAEQNFPMNSIEFGGIRGKGTATWLFMPFRLLQASLQCTKIVAQRKPNLVIGFGGYVTLPIGLAAKFMGKPLAIHEQNAVIGLSNKLLAKWTKHVFTAFPNVLATATVTGNPLRSEFANTSAPAKRFAGRVGPLQVLIVGGSLGARFLNETVPEAIKLIAKDNRPRVTHQSGQDQSESLQTRYQSLAVEATVVPFIKDTAQAFSDADLIICRAGASTVTEIAAVGAAAIFVPLPTAVDDHQTQNASYLASNNAAWLRPQNELTAQKLADEILKLDRNMLLEKAENAKKMSIDDAVNKIVMACEALVK